MDVSKQQEREFKVRLVLLNGQEKHGYIVRFLPQVRRLALIEEESNNVAYFDASEIAYVGFLRTEQSFSPLPKLAGMQERIVHTVIGHDFHVQSTDIKHEDDFFAFAIDEESPFERFFFYKHGIRNIEHPKPIGQTLVERKELSRDEVEKALAHQRELKTKTLGNILVEHKKIKPVDVKSALEKQIKKPQKIGEILLESGLIKQEDLNKALLEQAKNKRLRVGEVLINMGVLSEEGLIATLAKKFHLPYVDLNEYEINHLAFGQIDLDTLLHFQVLPIATDKNTLTLACSDPINFAGFDAVRFQTRKRITEVLAIPSQIKEHIAKEIERFTNDENDYLWIERIGDEGEDVEDEVFAIKAAETRPIVQLVDKILLNGINRNASDIHILPLEKELKVLYRINGDLQRALVLEKWVQRRVISRIKLLSGMNIADSRITQDGRLMVRHKEGSIEFRVSCIPNAFGESIVMRVLNKEKAIGLEPLGISEKDRKSLSNIIRRPYGLILSTGPTGSGKSTTLHALMQSIADLPLHIVTIEDPVELIIKGANQIQVNNKSGLTFANILRNVLRHDPDVIMLGEMRDEETASIGIEASLTGHMMLSTLHTNSATDTVGRLEDMGIPCYLLSSALHGIISQNLMKRLCEHCRKPFDSDADDIYHILEAMGYDRPSALYQPGQCEHCNQTGFSGRVMVYEYLEVTAPIRQAIHDGKVAHELQKLAEQEGMVPKAQHALTLAEQGIICRDDLMRLLI